MNNNNSVPEAVIRCEMVAKGSLIMNEKGRMIGETVGLRQKPCAR